MKLHLIIIATIVSALVGCSTGPDKEPSIDSLVGTYALTSEPESCLVKASRDGSVPDSRIELNKDLTLSIRNIPDCFDNPFGDSKGKLLSGEGTWKVVVPEGGATYGIDIDIAAGGTLNAGYYASHILFKEKSAPYKLHLIVGDPDNDNELVYDKTL